MCLGHLARNVRSLQENSQSEHADYCSYIINEFIQTYTINCKVHILFLTELPQSSGPAMSMNNLQL